MAVGLFVAVQLAVSLLAACAAFARAARSKSMVVRVLWLALGTAPFLAVNALVAWAGIALRFQLDAGNVPWGAGVFLLVAHVAGLVVVHARSRAAAWPVLPLAFAFVASAAVGTVVLWNLELQGRLRATALAIEAGRIAYREGPGTVRAELNAAPAYERAAAVVAPDEGTSVDDWGDALGADGGLDPHDAQLAAALSSWSSALESARAATRLPHCRFDGHGDDEILPVPRVIPFLNLARAFALEARVRAANGDVRGALDDVRALFGLANHLVETPVFLSVAMASVVQELGVDTLAHVLASERATAADLEAFELDAAPLSGDLLQHALRLEQAFGLGMLGLFAREGSASPASLGLDAFTRPESLLYTALLLEDDVRGYREAIALLAARAELPVAELGRVLARDADERKREIRSRGMLAMILVPNVEDRLMDFHRTDARVGLARVAVQAARYRAGSGSYPTAIEVGVSGPNVRVEGDGTFVLLRDVTPGFVAAPELRVPPGS